MGSSKVVNSPTRLGAAFKAVNQKAPHIYQWSLDYPLRTGLIVLFILSVIVHFAFFGHPGSAVFDEIYFNDFAGAYYTGKYYYDIHPPLGKLILALSTFPFGGINPDDVATGIGQAFGSHAHLAMRFTPSLAGTVLPLVIFLIVVELKQGYRAAFLAGLFVMLENSLLTQSRLILMDSILLLFGFTSIWLMLIYRRTQQWYWVALAGCCIGFGLGIKWIGFAFFGICGLVIFYDTVKTHWPSAVIFGAALLCLVLGVTANVKDWDDGLLYLASLLSVVFFTIFFINTIKSGALNLARFTAAAVLIGATFFVYVLIFFVHFSLLPNSNKQGDQFMTVEFQSTLKGSRFEGAQNKIKTFNCPTELQGKVHVGMTDVEVPVEAREACNIKYEAMDIPNFWEKFLELNRVMYTTNQNLTATHPDSSQWYQWPVMYNPIYYWVSEGERIYLLGNPWIWWAASLSVVCALVLVGCSQVSRRSEALWLLMVGYWSCLLPFMMITRVMFLYHYMMSLVFSIIILACLLTQLDDYFKGHPSFKWVLRAFVIGAVAVFLYVSPLTYGLDLYSEHLTKVLQAMHWQ